MKAGGGNPLKLFLQGFTLAEVLITLGIIGVVAAITIPGLINSYKAHQLRSQFLKSYSIITQVAQHMKNDEIDYDNLRAMYGDSYYWYGTYKVFKQYVKYSIDCGMSPTEKTYKYCSRKSTDTSKEYKTLFGNYKLSLDSISSGELILPDGTNLLFNRNVTVAVDLNGFANAPNRAGYDLFFFRYVDGNFLPEGFDGTLFSTKMRNYACNTSGDFNANNGMSCAQKAATQNDYFKQIVKKSK